MKKQLLVTGLMLFAMYINCPAQFRFQEAIGDTGSDYGNYMMQTADGGYIMTGPTLSFGTGGEVYLIKTDASGTIFVPKHFGGANADGSSCVRQTIDGGYIVAGYSSSFGAGGNDVYVLKTYDNLAITWSKVIGGTADDMGRSVRQTADSGYIVTGYTSSFGAGNRDVYLVKIDAGGNLLWTKTFGGAGNDEGAEVQQTTDGGYIIAGYTSSFGAGAHDIYLIKTDNAGNIVWTKTFGGFADDEARSVYQTSDGGYVVNGFTASYGSGLKDVYLIKTDDNGSIEWQKTFGGNNDDLGTTVQQTPDAGYIITGQTRSFGLAAEDVYLIRTDSIGNYVWSKTYGTLSGYDFGNCLDQTTDGGFAVFGISFSFSPVHADFYLIKTDNNGTSSCNEGNPPTLNTTPVPLISMPPTMTSAGGTIFQPNTTWWYGGSVIMNCNPVGINETAMVISGIYPNPSSGNFIIKFGNTILSGKIEINNLIGQKIFNETILNVSQKEIHLKNVESGIYFVKVRDGEKEYSEKLVIE